MRLPAFAAAEGGLFRAQAPKISARSSRSCSMPSSFFVVNRLSVSPAGTGPLGNETKVR